MCYLNLEVIVAGASILALFLSVVAILETKKAQKANLLLELIKQESELSLRVRESKEGSKYIEPYLNFFDGLGVLWDMIEESRANEYFKNMIIETAETVFIQKHIIKARKHKKDAYKNFQELYKKVGGKKWLKKIKK